MCWRECNLDLSTATSYLWSTGATTQSINVVASGSYTVQVKNASGCQSALSLTTVVTVTVIPSIPSIVTLTQPTCVVATGSVKLGNLPATGTWTINPGGYTGSGNSTTISGLAAGSYNFSVSSGGCSSPTIKSQLIVL